MEELVVISYFCGIFAVIVIIVILLPVLVFIHTYRRVFTVKQLNRRILIYCFSLFVLVGALASDAYAWSTVSKEDARCVSRQRYDCTNIVTIARIEIWLHVVTEPVSPGVCFTGNYYVCERSSGEVRKLVQRQEQYNYGLLTIMWVIVGGILGIPSFILYFILRFLYIMPKTYHLKQKEKHKNYP